MFATGETAYDRPIKTDEEVYIIWALGDLNSNGMVTKHTKRTPGNRLVKDGRLTKQKRHIPVSRLIKEGKVTQKVE